MKEHRLRVRRGPRHCDRGLPFSAGARRRNGSMRAEFLSELGGAGAVTTDSLDPPDRGLAHWEGQRGVGGSGSQETCLKGIVGLRG